MITPEIPNPTSSETNNRAVAVYAMAGDLTIYSVEERMNELKNRLAVAEPLEIDLAEITKCDCAGLQLLCSACKCARASGVPLRITRISPVVIDLARNIGLNPAEFQV